MSGTKISTSQMLATRLLHLTGGLQATTHVSGHMILYPTTKKETVKVGSSDERGYSSLFSHLGLDYFGYEEVSEEDGIKYSRWNVHTPNHESGDFVVQIWRQIAYTAMQKWNSGDEEIPQHIAFSLRASILRTRDVSRQHQFQNIYATHKKIADGRQFSNLEVFDLYMNLHSALVEMCSARDYLARFISQRILTGTDVDNMSSLYKRIKTGASDHPIADMIRCICDEARPDGWMARLSRYRNLVVHRAPITNISEKRFLTVNHLKVGTYELKKVYLGILKDPVNGPTNDYTDAFAPLA